MSEHGAAALEKALDQMERVRWRSVALARFLVFTSIVWLVLTHVVFLFSKAPWLGPIFALTTLYSIVGGMGCMLLGAVYKNTRAILKAIELVGRRESTE
jgi:uncharacterized membrane protein SirB2